MTNPNDPKRVILDSADVHDRRVGLRKSDAPGGSSSVVGSSSSVVVGREFGHDVGQSGAGGGFHGAGARGAEARGDRLAANPHAAVEAIGVGRRRRKSDIGVGRRRKSHIGAGRRRRSCTGRNAGRDARSHVQHHGPFWWKVCRKMGRIMGRKERGKEGRWDGGKMRRRKDGKEERWEGGKEERKEDGMGLDC